MAQGEHDFAVSVLQGLGIHPTNSNVKAMVGWTHAEGGHTHNTARWNFLNTTQPMPGAGNTGNQGNIKVYNSFEQGVQATVKTLKNGLYGGILSALRGSSPHAVAAAIDASPWGTHGSLIYQAIGGATISGNNTGSGFTISAPAAKKVAQGKIAPAQTGGFHTNIDAAIMDALASHTGSLGKAALANITSGRYDTYSAPAARAAKAAAGATTSAGAGATNGTPPDPSSTKGTTMFEGTRVAAWIAPALRYARSHGWHGAVRSGWRSFAEQKSIYDSGVRPAAVPGTSNHEGTDFPRGAVDVTDAAQLSQILLNSKYATQLIYAGAKDPVHFSHPHNGGY